VIKHVLSRTYWRISGLTLKLIFFFSLALSTLPAITLTLLQHVFLVLATFLTVLHTVSIRLLVVFIVSGDGDGRC